MAAHAGHTAETLRRAADPRSHASARRARHRLTRSQPAPAPHSQPPVPCASSQPPAPCASPQPRHGKEDMWSPQSDVLDDSTLSQTQNVRPMDGWLPPPPPTPPRTAPRARATGLSVTPRRHRPTRVNCGRRLHALPRDTTRRRRAPARRGGPPHRFPLPSIGKPEKYLAGHTPFAPHALAGAALLSRRAPLPRIGTLIEGRCARAR